MWIKTIKELAYKFYGNSLILLPEKDNYNTQEKIPCYCEHMGNHEKLVLDIVANNNGVKKFCCHISSCGKRYFTQGSIKRTLQQAQDYFNMRQGGRQTMIITEYTTHNGPGKAVCPRHGEQSFDNFRNLAKRRVPCLACSQELRDGKDPKKLIENYENNKMVAHGTVGKGEIGKIMYDEIYRYAGWMFNAFLFPGMGGEHRRLEEYGFKIDWQNSFGVENDREKHKAFGGLNVRHWNMPYQLADAFKVIRNMTDNCFKVTHIDMCGNLTPEVVDAVQHLIDISKMKATLIFVTYKRYWRNKKSKKYNAEYEKTGCFPVKGAKVLWVKDYPGDHTTMTTMAILVN